MNQYVVWFGSLMWAGLSCIVAVLMGYMLVPPQGVAISQASRGEIQEMAGVGIFVYVLAQIFLRYEYWSALEKHPWIAREVLLLVVAPTIAWILFPDWPLYMAGVLFLVAVVVAYQDFLKPIR